MDLLCFCSVLCLLCFVRVYMCFVVTCWERADLLALVCGVYCEFVTFPLVSLVRCGTRLYRFLIFASLLTLTVSTIRNSYTMGCPPVRGDNPQALASGLSYVQVDKHGITILYHLHQCRPCTSRNILCISW